MENKKIIWSDASLPGLVLGAVPVAYFLLSLLIVKLPGAVQGVTSLVAWAVKFFACIWLFRFYMKNFANDREGVTRQDAYRFGVAVALYSAFIVALFQYVYCTVIAPDYLKDTIELALREAAPKLDSNSLNALDSIIPQLPMISFVSNLVWCFLFGLVLSGIFSRKICSDNISEA